MHSFNWEYITAMFFALAFVFVILMTVGFYVNYKRDQWQRKTIKQFNPVNGRFFKRFIPGGLKGKYARYLEGQN